MDGAPIAYGDLRMRTERRNGCCLFWVRGAPLYPRPRCRGRDARPAPQVVPQVSPGFNVPEFYETFLEQQPAAEPVAAAAADALAGAVDGTHARGIDGGTRPR